jgi:hypothetical protein
MRGLLKGVVRKFENRAGGGELGDQVEGWAPKRAKVAIRAPKLSGRA